MPMRSSGLALIWVLLVVAGCGGSEPSLLERGTSDQGVGEIQGGGPSARGEAIAFGDGSLQVADEGFVVRGWRAGTGMEDVPISVAISTPSRPRCGGFITYTFLGAKPREGSLGS